MPSFSLARAACTSISARAHRSPRPCSSDRDRGRRRRRIRLRSSLRSGVQPVAASISATTVRGRDSGGRDLLERLSRWASAARVFRGSCVADVMPGMSTRRSSATICEPTGRYDPHEDRAPLPCRLALRGARARSPCERSRPAPAGSEVVDRRAPSVRCFGHGENGRAPLGLPQLVVHRR